MLVRHKIVGTGKNSYLCTKCHISYNYWHSNFEKGHSPLPVWDMYWPRKKRP